MRNINGNDNEYHFVQAFNGKKVYELNPLLRNVIDDLFFNVSDNAHISCWRNYYKQKSDIFIKINNVMKGISIKKGSRNSVHVEGITNFTHFLITCGIEKEVINEYLKYHYADGTTNGNGKNRVSVLEYKLDNQEIIDSINKVFNQDHVIKKAINRFVIKGNNSDYDIDGLVLGEIDDFLWINKNDIMQIILAKKGVYSSAIHFGSLVCQPKNRCINFNTKYEKDRHCVQIKWYSLFDDIIEYMNKKEYVERK